MNKSIYCFIYVYVYIYTHAYTLLCIYMMGISLMEVETVNLQSLYEMSWDRERLCIQIGKIPQAGTEKGVLPAHKNTVSKNRLVICLVSLGLGRFLPIYTDAFRALKMVF